MKKSLLAAAVFISFNSMSTAQNSPNDFRGFKWGDLITQIKSDEKAKFVSQDNNYFITYEDNLAGSDVMVNFQFNDNNKLVSGSYVFTKKYSNPQLYIQDYAKFKGLLTTKYSDPKLDKVEWSSNTTPNDKENYGQAVANGNLSLYTVWKTTRSLIKIILTSDNERPYLQIHYTALSLNELENKDELKSALPKL